MRSSLVRMEAFQPMIDAKLQQYKLPVELLAVPIVESGYQNMGSSQGAGIWMFIKNTARHYGLRVDAQHDDRFNTDLETVAAMRYLGSNYTRFNDWLLALVAYNAGESSVQDGIDQTGSRDAWTLIDAGYDGDKDYLAQVMAAAIILKNPSLVN
jgi:membrane-bound lytic murein transglycosylase D